MCNHRNNRPTIPHSSKRPTVFRRGIIDIIYELIKGSILPVLDDKVRDQFTSEKQSQNRTSQGN